MSTTAKIPLTKTAASPADDREPADWRSGDSDGGTRSSTIPLTAIGVGVGVPEGVGGSEVRRRCDRPFPRAPFPSPSLARENSIAGLRASHDLGHWRSPRYLHSGRYLEYDNVCLRTHEPTP